ncbi:PREDICTED: breast carcinoma-amplified sequence 4-like, partial [Fulmarus glacialis]|uniref:breast carcinoma-amplified sequence 4-like n=1 Tax=Fulmarus glacialis TaxID=30455 RepID=UPI00051B033D
IRSDTSQILDETIPLVKDKVMEMNHIYAKVDKLEAFVKMVAHHVSFLEEQVLEAEKSHGTFLNTVCKLFQCATISSFKNRHPLSAARSYDLPKLYRTEDFFPMNYVALECIIGSQSDFDSSQLKKQNKSTYPFCEGEKEEQDKSNHLHLK